MTIQKRGLQKRMVIASFAFLAYSICLWIYPDWFGDKRQLNAAIALTVFCFLGLFSWALCSRTFSSCILMGFLIAWPMNEAQAQQAQPPGKDNFVMIFCGCVVLAGGIIVILGLRKLCKKLPPLSEYGDTNSPAPPITPAPPWTNITLWPGGSQPTCDSGLALNDAAIDYHIIANPLPPDINGASPAPWLYWSHGQVQESSDLSTWTESVTYTNWWSANGILAIWSTNGVAFMTNYSPAVQGNAINPAPVPLAMPRERQRFYRLVSN